MSEYDQAVAIADTYMRAMTAGDLETVLALYADEATVEDPVGSAPHVGKEAIAAFYQGAIGVDITCTRTGPVRYANREMVFPFRCVMKSPDGAMQIDIIDHFVLNDQDQVVSMRAFWSHDTASTVSA